MVNRTSIFIFLNLFLYAVCDTPSVIHIQPIYRMKYDADFKNKPVTEIVSQISEFYQLDMACELTNQTVSLLSKEMPFWKLVAEVSRRANLGIHAWDYPILFSSNSEKISCYDVAGPYLVLCRENLQDRKLEIPFIYLPEEADIYTATIDQIELYTNGSPQIIPGELIKYSDGKAEWQSDEPVKLLPGVVIKGSIKSKVLTDQYIILGLGENTVLKHSGILIEVSKYDPNTPLFHIAGKMSFSPDSIGANCSRIHIEPYTDLTEEDRLFLQQNRNAYESKNYKEFKLIENKYYSLKDKLPSLEVSDMWHCENKSDMKSDLIKRPVLSKQHKEFIAEESIDEDGYICDIYTEVLFNEVQDDENVFPLGIHLLKYKMAEKEFTLQILPTN